MYNMDVLASTTLASMHTTLVRGTHTVNAQYYHQGSSTSSYDSTRVTMERLRSSTLCIIREYIRARMLLKQQIYYYSSQYYITYYQLVCTLVEYSCQSNSLGVNVCMQYYSSTYYAYNMYIHTCMQYVDTNSSSQNYYDSYYTSQYAQYVL